MAVEAGLGFADSAPGAESATGQAEGGISRLENIDVSREGRSGGTGMRARLGRKGEGFIYKYDVNGFS